MSAGPKIAIVGSCQVSGLAAAASSLLPGCEVSSWHVGASPGTPQEIADKLPEFDFVISQISDTQKNAPELGLSVLKDRLKSLSFIPTLVFNGFHPDWVYIHHPGQLISAPVTHHYHSAILVAAFLNGYSERRTLDLFNGFVFSALDYPVVFSEARAAVIQNFSVAGYDISALFADWISHVGQFMYTFNHPHIYPLSSLCKMLLVNAGLIEKDTEIPGDVHDYLQSHVVLPVYPFLAKKLGFPGTASILKNIPGPVRPIGEREMPLAEYIKTCFAHYKDIDRKDIDHGAIPAVRKRLEEYVIS